MSSFAPCIIRLIDEFAKLPSIGPKTAQRLAYHLLKRPAPESEALCQAVLEAKRKVRNCRVCFNYTEENPCAICADPRRDQAKICVVEQASDILPFERTAAFHGLYHVLGGALSPLDGVTHEDIRVSELLTRIKNGVTEVIVATNSSSAGEATALYLAKRLKDAGEITVTRIARGIPMGSELEFADEVTLYRALLDRVGI